MEALLGQLVEPVREGAKGPVAVRQEAKVGLLSSVKKALKKANAPSV